MAACALCLIAPRSYSSTCDVAGAFVLDRVRGIAYLNISERADVGLAEQWVQDLGYRVRGLLVIKHPQPRYQESVVSLVRLAEHWDLAIWMHILPAFLRQEQQGCGALSCRTSGLGGSLPATLACVPCEDLCKKLGIRSRGKISPCLPSVCCDARAQDLSAAGAAARQNRAPHLPSQRDVGHQGHRQNEC